jgi:WhiB family transcriptional regulator, redox-sensing transcriptional regulator
MAVTGQASASARAAVRPPAGSWRSIAACRSVDPDLFFPASASGERLEQVSEAKAICAGCQARRECVAFALRTRQMHGIWGGMTEAERCQAILARRPAHASAGHRAGLTDTAESADSPGKGGGTPTTPAAVPVPAPSSRRPAPAGTRGLGVQRPAAAPPGSPASRRGADELVRAQTAVVRLAAERMTGPMLEVLLDNVERASGLPTKPEWERKAAAHADIFRLLAKVATIAGDGGAGLARDLMHTVGPGANGMITGSRRRLLAHLRAQDAEAAASEIENHLRALQIMGRLASWSREATSGRPHS